MMFEDYYTKQQRLNESLKWLEGVSKKHKNQFGEEAQTLFGMKLSEYTMDDLIETIEILRSASFEIVDERESSIETSNVEIIPHKGKLRVSIKEGNQDRWFDVDEKTAWTLINEMYKMLLGLDRGSN